jgi:hypothetical protein
LAGVGRAQHVLRRREKIGVTDAVKELAAAPSETHTDAYCLHPYFGFVCTPGARIDFSESVPAHFGHGAVALIDRHGFRNRHVPDVKPENEFWIGLFGGSVAFSSAASDDSATIAGQLEARLHGQPFDGKRVRVVNLALPAGQQPQQLLICALHLERLDGVITFDGVNEVVIPGSYNAGTLPVEFPYRPIYQVLYGGGVSDEQVALSWRRRIARERFENRPWLLRALTAPSYRAEAARLTKQLRETAPAQDFHSLFDSPVSPADAVARGAETWRSCTERMHALCQASGVRTLFTVQPIPDRQKPLTSNEQAALDRYRDVVTLRRSGHALVLEKALALKQRGLPVELMTDVFEGRAEEIYTDLIHFEDRGCALVAERLATLVRDAWSR